MLSPNTATIQYLRDKLRNIQAMIREYQTVEQETLGQLAAALCCLKPGEEVTSVLTGEHLIVTRVKFQPDAQALVEDPEFNVEFRFTDDSFAGCHTSKWTTNAGLQRAFTKVDK